MISHVDGKIDDDNLRSFVAAYQTIVPLKLGELWAIPIMLRLALIENLRRVAARLAAIGSIADLADHWADRMLETADTDPQNLILVTADMARSEPPMTSAFVAELQRRLQGHGAALTYPLTWIEQSPGGRQLVDRAVAALGISTAGGRPGFDRQQHWQPAISRIDGLARIRRSDERRRADAAQRSGGVYARADFATRDACRHVVEKTAKHSPLSERDVARAAIELARARASSVGPHDRTAHVGYFLLDEGLATLEQRVKLRAPLLESLAHFGRRHAAALYLGAILLLTLLAAAGAAMAAGGRHTPLPLMVARRWCWPRSG